MRQRAAGPAHLITRKSAAGFGSAVKTRRQDLPSRHAVETRRRDTPSRPVAGPEARALALPRREAASSGHLRGCGVTVLLPATRPVFGRPARAPFSYPVVSD